MLEKSFGMDSAAAAVWKAMRQVFADGFTTSDLGKGTVIGTADFGDRVVATLEKLDW